ncbi:MAG TPA: serine hydrolase domain-containing protein [Dehalococcoidia bacterium]|nr:serine hydrolase domain-containing protein [Dehalococcoidia bacterium]
MIDTRFVTSRPEEVGIDSERLAAVFARAQRDVDERVSPSAQVAVARRGKLAGMRTFGRAVQGGEERPATDETLYGIFSCTKAIVAAAVWLLLEEGLLRLEERVADIIPEFGTNGKGAITVEQVLLHTAGFPYAPYHPDAWGDRSKMLEAFSRWRLNWEPDSRFEYHATSAHWVLSEIIYRRTGVEYRAFIRERITGPMGLDDLFVGLPPEQDGRVAAVRYVGEPVEPPGGWGEVTPEAILGFNRPQVWRVGVPGGGGIASAAEMAIFYQTLVNGGETADGRRILKRETIEFATTVRTKKHHRDPVFGIPINRGLSIMVAGDDGNAFMRGFGRVASARAFGHGGAGGQIAWGDPETGISVGYCTNGFTDWMTTARRITAISSLAAACAPGTPAGK